RQRRKLPTSRRPAGLAGERLVDLRPRGSSLAPAGVIERRNAQAFGERAHVFIADELDGEAGDRQAAVVEGKRHHPGDYLPAATARPRDHIERHALEGVEAALVARQAGPVAAAVAVAALHQVERQA